MWFLVFGIFFGVREWRGVGGLCLLWLYFCEFLSWCVVFHFRRSLVECYCVNKGFLNSYAFIIWFSGRTPAFVIAFQYFSILRYTMWLYSCTYIWLGWLYPVQSHHLPNAFLSPRLQVSAQSLTSPRSITWYKLHNTNFSTSRARSTYTARTVSSETLQTL